MLLFSFTIYLAFRSRDNHWTLEIDGPLGSEGVIYNKGKIIRSFIFLFTMFRIPVALLSLGIMQNAL